MQEKNNIISFARESYVMMQKFARFFGLSDILKVSNEDLLAKQWNETI